MKRILEGVCNQYFIKNMITYIYIYIYIIQVVLIARICLILSTNVRIGASMYRSQNENVANELVSASTPVPTLIVPLI